VYLATFSNQLLVYGLLPRPSLNIRLSGNNVVLTWPTNLTLSYKLQSSTNPISGSWMDNTNGVTMTNGNYHVTQPASGVGTFYRLKL
jgi:hypothetical protein